MFLESLRPGDRFEASSGKAGTLVVLNPGSVTVRFDGFTDCSFVPLSGPNAGKEVSFTRPAETTQISRRTEVIRLAAE